MKSTGIVRQIDELGRLVIPVELRRNLNINVKDGLEIFTEGDTIILRKYEPLCSICNGGNEIRHFKGKRICKDCIDELKKEK